jgi:hypothetical protein
MKNLFNNLVQMKALLLVKFKFSQILSKNCIKYSKGIPILSNSLAEIDPNTHIEHEYGNQFKRIEASSL